jgi:hypothetical protein
VSGRDRDSLICHEPMRRLTVSVPLRWLPHTRAVDASAASAAARSIAPPPAETLVRQHPR